MRSRHRLRWPRRRVCCPRHSSTRTVRAWQGRWRQRQWPPEYGDGARRRLLQAWDPSDPDGFSVRIPCRARSEPPTPVADDEVGWRMSERLRARDLAFLATDSPASPMHNATLEIFQPGRNGFDYADLTALIADRIAFVPRYRQRLQQVPGRLANPIWIDDDRFDLSFHVRRSGLPRPGTMEQLRELVGRIMSRPLDVHRPLWEVYFIEGLAEGRVALLSKSHQILVDGIETVDLGQVLLDTSPEGKELERDDWMP